MTVSEAFVAAVQDKSIAKFEAFPDTKGNVREIQITFTDGTEFWINGWDVLNQGLMGFFRTQGVHPERVL